ncbi:hypothetical protein DFH07DRAFT_943051 [Mycena maculata]|uniref:Uncharacterized protein n=1 Tax=Mycena maculata TaxID=230809 RepID=A0AAD7IJ14_9AGAR|nr:hypothetical protein DFH07DRAFT_943051 [Mycena maculata]
MARFGDPVKERLGLRVEMAKFGSVPFSPNAKPEPGLWFSNLLNPEPELGIQFQGVRFRSQSCSTLCFGTPFTCQTHTKWVEKFKDNSYYLPHIVKHMLSIVCVQWGGISVGSNEIMVNNRFRPRLSPVRQAVDRHQNGRLDPKLGGRIQKIPCFYKHDYEIEQRQSRQKERLGQAETIWLGGKNDYAKTADKNVMHGQNPKIRLSKTQ